MKNSIFEAVESRLIAEAKKSRVVVPMAADEAVAEALSKALDKGLVSTAILVGNSNEIKDIFGKTAEDERIKIIEASSDEEALLLSCNEIKGSNADILMKGMCQSLDLIRAVVRNLEQGFLSHLTCFSLPNKEEACILTDAAVNISPTEEVLSKEIQNARELFEAVSEALGDKNGGEKEVKVALLAANEKVSDKMPSTKLAELVAEKHKKESGLVVEGPLSFDLALSPHSAQIKKYKGRIQGNANILVAPRIETANALYKSLAHYIHADMGGVLYGACCPVVHPSRADSTETKYNSLLLALTLRK